eukprot:2179188-Rhodomonas_salina.1
MNCVVKVVDDDEVAVFTLCTREESKGGNFPADVKTGLGCEVRAEAVCCDGERNCQNVKL